jgi:DNA-binding MarR family transcriptional regulator
VEEDWADRHVERWRNHWIDVQFDDEVEAVFVRIGRLGRHLRQAKRAAAAEVGMQDHEYDTLHELMIRTTPGSASPSELAEDLGISGAGMTGRLDALERAGWIQRRATAEDRRRVQVEVTKAGSAKWREAINLRGRAEEELMAGLSARERATLARLLKKLTLAADDV